MSPVQGKSPLVQIKEPYGNLDMVTCRLGMYNVHLSIMLESEREAVYRERHKTTSNVTTAAKAPDFLSSPQVSRSLIIEIKLQ